MKGYNDKTDKYINHEESDDNDVDKVKASYYWSIIMNGAHIFLVGVNGHVQNAIKKENFETLVVIHIFILLPAPQVYVFIFI